MQGKSKTPSLALNLKRCFNFNCAIYYLLPFRYKRMSASNAFFDHLTHRKTLYIPVLAVGILLLTARLVVRDDQLLNVVVWSVVIFSCMITSLNYFLILRKTWNTIRSNIIVWQSATIFVLGLISSCILLSTIWKTWDTIAEAKFEFSSTILFHCTAAARIVHCYLGGK